MASESTVADGGAGSMEPVAESTWESTMESTWESTPRREIAVELLRAGLRATGLLDTGHFARLSDYVNAIDGFCLLRDATLHAGPSDPVRHLEFHIRFEDIALIAETRLAPRAVDSEQLVPKEARRLVFVTPSLVVSGMAYLHLQASLEAFLDARDPAFVPLTDVVARWITGGEAGQYQFALLQRRHILGVAGEASDVPQVESQAEAVAS